MKPQVFLAAAALLVADAVNAALLRKNRFYLKPLREL
jgi:hypothetical protein